MRCPRAVSALKSPRNNVAWPLPHDELIVSPKKTIFISNQFACAVYREQFCFLFVRNHDTDRAQRDFETLPQIDRRAGNVTDDGFDHVGMRDDRDARLAMLLS